MSNLFGGGGDKYASTPTSPQQYEEERRVAREQTLADARLLQVDRDALVAAIDNDDPEKYQSLLAEINPRTEERLKRDSELLSSARERATDQPGLRRQTSIGTPSSWGKEALPPNLLDINAGTRKKALLGR